MKKTLFISMLLVCLHCLLGLPQSAAQQSNNSSPPQSGKIRGKVVSENNNEPMPGAVIEIAPAADTTAKKYYTSAFEGAIEIPEMPLGNYVVNVSFLGYKSFTRKVNLNKASVNIGTVVLRMDSRQIETIEVEGQAMRTSQRGDTLSYNASAFKVAQDADTEALLSKMPGITVLNGQVEAQGETIEKVFVDGKEFFGQDVSTTIKSLPAEVVSSIEVYDKLSDQAEFSGVDDGEGVKAINIVTKINKGQFGKVAAGYGFTDKYNIGVNINAFNGDHRFSLIGMVNNVNQQNFAAEDILGAMGSGRGMSSGGGGHMRMRGMRAMMTPQLDGVSTTQSVGLNYQSVWGRKKNVDVTASYFFTNSKNEQSSEAEREYTDNTFRTMEIDQTSGTRNNEHRFNARIDYKINENHNLRIRPRVSFQNYKSNSISLSETFEPQDPADPGIITRSSSYLNDNDSRNWGYNIANNIVYRVRLGKPGRTLSLDLYGNMSNNDRDSYRLSSRTLFGVAPAEEDSHKKIDSHTQSYNVNGSLVYAEPVTANSQITAQYRVSYRYSDSERLTYDRVAEAWDMSDEESNTYNSGYLVQRAGPGYNYNKDRNRFNASVFYQRSSLANDQEFPAALRTKASFDNVVYFARMEHSFNPNNTMRLRARSSTSNPTVAQLQDVTDYSNLMSISGGNPDLKPSYEHSIFGNFINSDVENGRTFMVMARFSTESNYIADAVTTDENYVLPNGEQLGKDADYTTYRNMNGYWSIRGGVSYGFPVKAIKSNLNLNLGANYNKIPSMLNGVKKTTGGQYYNAGVVLGSNISEKIDFTISYNAGYNISENTARGLAGSTSEFFTQYASLRFKWVAWLDFTFSGDASYIQNRSVTGQEFNEENVMCNLYIGKKVFRNRRGEVIFGVNDLLDQKTAFRRNERTDYIENIKYNTLGRWFSVQFVYNIRGFGKGSSGGVMPESLGSPAPVSRPQMQMMRPPGSRR